MLTNEERFRLGSNDPRLSAPPPGLLGRIVGSVITAAVLVVAFTFSVLIFTAIAAVALVAGSYLWWKTRALRRQLRERPRGGHVIDGEVIREAEPQDKNGR
jgi:hypothetical protein